MIVATVRWIPTAAAFVHLFVAVGCLDEHAEEGADTSAEPEVGDTSPNDTSTTLDTSPGDTSTTLDTSPNDTSTTLDTTTPNDTSTTFDTSPGDTTGDTSTAETGTADTAPETDAAPIAPCEAEDTVVDSGPGVGLGVGIAVTDDGKVFVAYSDDDNVDLRVAVRAVATGDWTTAIIDHTGFTYHRSPSVAAWDGQVTIFYESSAGGYAYTSPGSETFTVKARQGALEHVRGPFGTDFITQSGHAHAANPLGGDLALQFESFAHPDCPTVDGERRVQRDSRGGLHVVTRCGPNHGPFYAYKAPGGMWRTHWIDTHGGDFVALALDADDTVHILYRRDYSNNLHHAWRPITESVSQFSDNSFSGAGPLALIVDQRGDLHAFFHTLVTGLRHRVMPHGSPHWSARPDIGTHAGGAVAATLGPDGSVHLAFQDTVLGGVRYSRVCTP